MGDLEIIVWAVQNGDLGKVMEFVEQDAFDVNLKMKYGKTLISVAADYGQTEVLSYLIARGATVDYVDENGMTPLLIAIYENHSKCVSLLIEKGADKTRKTPSGTSYYECAEKDDIKKLLE